MSDIERECYLPVVTPVGFCFLVRLKRTQSQAVTTTAAAGLSRGKSASVSVMRVCECKSDEQ